MNIKKYIIRDGQFTGYAVATFILSGLLIIYLSTIIFDNSESRYIGISIGILLTSIGGYSGRAYSLGIRPFQESEWRKSKKTYSEEDTMDKDQK